MIYRKEFVVALTGAALLLCYSCSCEDTSEIAPHTSRYDLSMWENFVVWQGYKSGQWNIMLYEIDTGRKRKLTSEPESTDKYRREPSIFGNYVVWLERPADIDDMPESVVLFNIKTGQKTVIAEGTPGYRHYPPRIYGNHVVWSRESLSPFERREDVMLYDIANANTIVLAEDESVAAEPAIYELTVCWFNLHQDSVNCYLLDEGRGESYPIDVSFSFIVDTAMYEDLFVFIGVTPDPSFILAYDVYLLDLTTGELHRITFDGRYKPRVRIYDKLVVWSIWSSSNAHDYGSSMFVFDVDTCQTSLVRSSEFPLNYLAIWGDYIAWIEINDIFIYSRDRGEVVAKVD